ncbi:MAG: hypothetical protein RR588_08050 [Solibacillus sp.]
MNKHYFYQYDSTKWDWTIQASQKFMNGFKRFDTNIEHKEQVYVGVYGPTQVGKTTFILTLLGISSIYLNDISDKLRGGREKGKSATITCTIFEKSSNNEFHFIWPTGERFQCTKLDEVEKIMGDLRQSVYKNQSFSLEPLTIKIPSRYFIQEKVDARVRELAIMDLPGDDSKDILEMRHVDKILKEYIARCKVCIIMEISSQLTGLTKLDKEIVRDWQELPEQFRIVLTRSISNDSILLDIQNGTINSTEKLLAEYEYQLGRVCDIKPLQTRVYPLEFGDSWSELQKKFPHIFANAAVWVDELFSSLVEDLTQIHSPEQEIKKLKSMERYIEKHQKEELNRLREHQKIAESELEQVHTDMQLYVRHLKKESEKQERLQQFKQKWSKLSYKLEYLPSLPEWSDLSLYEKKSSYLRTRYVGELEDLKDAVVNLAKEINDVVRESRLFNEKGLRSFQLEDAWFDRHLMTDYVMDRYFLASTYTDDKKRGLTAIKDCIAQIDTSFQKYKNENLCQLQKMCDEQKKIYLVKQEDFNSYEQQYNEKKLELEKLGEDIFVAIEEWTFDKERASQLDLFLMESYLTKAESFKRKLFDEKTDPVEKWFVHFYWNVMKEQAKGLITNE